MRVLQRTVEKLRLGMKVVEVGAGLHFEPSPGVLRVLSLSDLPLEEGPGGIPDGVEGARASFLYAEEAGKL
jgi:hypothetical protein